LSQDETVSEAYNQPQKISTAVSFLTIRQLFNKRCRKVDIILLPVFKKVEAEIQKSKI